MRPSNYTIPIVACMCENAHLLEKRNMTPSEVILECNVLGNRKPNSDLWDENNRKERAGKINSYKQKHRFSLPKTRVM